ncbi:MAG: hypothetical protein PHQ86_01975 [Dehalococcoidales bacterium]|nr:hypothetical protein [Dehalococcoidales bacterium]
MVTAIKDIIKDENFEKSPRDVKLGDRKRISIPTTNQHTIYSIYTNRLGQILLDPQATIPASELWVFKNKKVLAMIDKGMSEEKVINRGSFASFVKNEA